MIKILVVPALPLDGAQAHVERLGGLFDAVPFLVDQLAKAGLFGRVEDAAAAADVVFENHLGAPPDWMRRANKSLAEARRRRESCSLPLRLRERIRGSPSVRGQKFTLAKRVAHFQHKSWRICFGILEEIFWEGLADLASAARVVSPLRGFGGLDGIITVG